MAGYLQLAQAARAANARIRSARELETRWNALGPEGQAEARDEWDRLTAALVAARARVAAGPRGFVREFSAAYKGVEAETTPDPRPIGALLGELHAATNALRDKLDAVGAQAEADREAAPAAAATSGSSTATPAATDPSTAAATATAPTPDPPTTGPSETAGGPSPYEHAEAEQPTDGPSPYEQAATEPVVSPYEQAERASAAPTPEDPAHR